MTAPEARPGESKIDVLAKLFDLRTFMGVLFLIFGAIVTIVGIGASEADIQKAAGINLSLILGLIMLALGAFFIGWMLLRPPEIVRGHETSEEDLPEQLRDHGLLAPGERSTDEPPPGGQRRSRPPLH